MGRRSSAYVHEESERAARALLGSVVPFELDERVRDRILAETRGNPLALMELPRGLGPVQLAGEFGLIGVQAVPARVERVSSAGWRLFRPTPGR